MLHPEALSVGPRAHVLTDILSFHVRGKKLLLVTEKGEMYCFEWEMMSQDFKTHLNTEMWTESIINTSKSVAQTTKG